MAKIISTYAIGLILASSFVFSACSSDACGDAIDKVQTCLDALNCNNVDALSRTACLSAQTRMQSAINDFENVVCTAEIETLAEEINSCALSPESFCVCP